MSEDEDYQNLQIIDIENKPDIIQVPKNIKETDIDYFLSIHVRKKESNWYGYIKSEHGNWYHEVDRDTKIEYECNRFMNVLLNAEKGSLKEFSPILNEFYESTGKDGIARTMRILFGLQSLFTVDKGLNENETIEGEIAKLKNECSLLQFIVDKVKDATYETEYTLLSAHETKENWHIALPLIAIIAVAYSQCKFAGPVFWEAFSAGAARNELEAKLSTQPEVKNALLNSISYLIRYQTEPGQYLRHTGSGAHLSKNLRNKLKDKESFLFNENVVFNNCPNKCSSNNTQQICSESRTMLETALIIIALIEELRNSFIEKLPKKVKNILPGIEDILESNESKKWYLDEVRLCYTLQKNLLKPYKGMRHSKKTWGYSGLNYLGKHFFGDEKDISISEDILIRAYNDNDKDAKKQLCREIKKTYITECESHFPVSKNVSIEKRIINEWLIWDETSEIYYKLIKRNDSFKICKQDKSLNVFKEFFERNIYKITEISPKKICRITFDSYSFSRRIKFNPFELEANYVRRVISNETDKITELNKYFTIMPVEIPSCFGEEESNYAIRITLKDHIKAQSMLPFLETKIDTKEIEEGNLKGETAGHLLNYLFQRTWNISRMGNDSGQSSDIFIKPKKNLYKNETNFEYDNVEDSLKIWFAKKGKTISESAKFEELYEDEKTKKIRIINKETQNNKEQMLVYRIEIDKPNQLSIYDKDNHYYIPLPIIEEILKVVYKLRPDSCVTLPIRYNDDDIDYIHIPAKPEDIEDIELRYIIAHYVWGKILNRAMSKGFHEGDEPCKIGTTRLSDKWQEIFEEAYFSNSYENFLEDYYNQFKTNLQNVNRKANIYPSTIGYVPIQNIDKKLKLWIDQDSNSDKFVLGIDIGATSIKYILYKINNNGQLLSPEKNGSLSVKSDQIYTPEGFVRRIIEHIHTNISYNCLENTCAIGISWPGAVKENRVFARSHIITNFVEIESGKEYSFDTDIKKIIKDFNIVDLFQTCWEKKFHKPNMKYPVIALINDGDAHAFGSVYDIEHEKESDIIKSLIEKMRKAGCELVVIKAGTGTAGAVFDSEGRLVTNCLMEWGKLLLDLGPLFDPNPLEERYPRGRMNAYCSMKTLPNLASEKLKSSFGKEDPKYDVIKLGIESAEIGYMLELGNFVDDCGNIIVDVNDESAEKIKNILYNQNLKFQLIEKIGENICKKIRLKKPSSSQKNELGEPRLREIFNNSMDDDNYQNAFNIARESIKIFGFYLADQIALLHQNYRQMQVVVLGGGVLSGYTRFWAIKNARDRLKNCYNLELKYGRNYKEDFEKNTVYYYTEFESNQGVKKQDYGIFGSALIGVREMILKLNRNGLEEIRKIIISMKENTMAELIDAEFQYEQKTVNLKEFALDLEDVEKYLQVYGQKMGLLYSTRSTKEGKTCVKYTRWFSEQ